jgi:hypothetical protein
LFSKELLLLGPALMESAATISIGIPDYFSRKKYSQPHIFSPASKANADANQIILSASPYPGAEKSDSQLPRRLSGRIRA